MLQATHRIPGLVLEDHEFEVPLDYQRPDGERIRVFCRVVDTPDTVGDERPWLVFFQGGPGFGAPRPMAKSGWIARALEEYRVVLLDERGTGRSTPQSYQTLAGLTPEAQADRLACFRSDSIVRDAELVRAALCGSDTKWTALGQSYGGFCTVRYLSSAPQGLSGAILTGGLPPLAATADDVYRRTYPHVLDKNRRYYDRYPSDVERVRGIARVLADREVRLPCGDVLSVRRFQQLGLLLGMSDGFEALHYLLEDAFVPGTDEIGYAFLRGFENALHFDTNPFFAILHEACYTQETASGWAAHRIRDDYREFELGADRPLYFTGEMIYPWMFEEIGALRPLRESAEILAAKRDWPRLYDRDALARNDVPAVAAIYANDMYVDRGYSEDTARAIGGLRPWLTDEYEHNGLRADGRRVLGRLIDMLHGRV